MRNMDRSLIQQDQVLLLGINSGGLLRLGAMSNKVSTIHPSRFSVGQS